MPQVTENIRLANEPIGELWQLVHQDGEMKVWAVPPKPLRLGNVPLPLHPPPLSGLPPRH